MLVHNMDDRVDEVHMGIQGKFEQPEGTQSIERALSLLALVSSAGVTGASLTELVIRSGLKQPTTHRLLTALGHAGLVEQDDETKRYYLGYESYVLGILAAPRFGIGVIAQGSVARLAHLSEDTAFLTVRRGFFSVCLHREEGTYPIRALVWPAGARHPLGVGTGSIAMLAALPDGDVRSIVKANAPLYKERYSGITPELVLDLVSDTRKRGFCGHSGLGYPGVGGIGVAVRDEYGQPTAALAIGAAESRLNKARQETLAKILHEEAEKIYQLLKRTVLSNRALGRGRNSARNGGTQRSTSRK